MLMDYWFTCYFLFLVYIFIQKYRVLIYNKFWEMQFDLHIMGRNNYLLF